MNRLRGVCAVLILQLFWIPETDARQTLSPTHVIYRSDDGLAVDNNESIGLRVGDVGLIRRKGVDWAVVRVIQAGRTQALLQIISQLDSAVLQSGDVVFFDPRSSVQTKTPMNELDKVVLSGAIDSESNWLPVVSTPMVSGSTLKKHNAPPEEEFVPLLAPIVTRRVAASQSANIFHGRLRARQIYQTLNTTHADDWATRVDSDGSVDRIQGTSWNFLWSGNMSYRAGDTFSTANDFHQARLHVYRLTLARKTEDSGLDRLGRILPVELPGLGYIDGAQSERKLNGDWRLGGVLGFRPDRINLSAVSDEPIGSVYGTLERGDRGHFYYTGTLGLLQSVFKRKADELAFLWDQRMDLGSRVNIYSTSQLDMDAGGAEFRHGARLTRLDLNANASLVSFLNARAGMSHYERPDIAAERALYRGLPITTWDAGYWRYWTGLGETLPWGFTLDQEVSVIRSNDSPAEGSWRLSAGHHGLPYMEQASVNVSVYDLNVMEGEGYGGIVTALFPFAQNRLNINANAGFRYRSLAGEAKQFKTADVAVHADWRITSNWTLDAGVSRTYQDYLHSTVADAALSYRW